MKTQHIKGTTHTPDKFPGILAAFITALLTFNVLPKAWSADLFWTGNAATLPANAGSGAWVTPLASSSIPSWSIAATSNTGASWADDNTANFVGKPGGTVTLSNEITTAGINFDPGAGAFTILTNGNLLQITGSIMNDSGLPQTIKNNVAGGAISFSGAASGGNVTLLTPRRAVVLRSEMPRPGAM
jgi:hypothetical protein